MQLRRDAREGEMTSQETQTVRERTGGDRRHLMDVIGLAIARLLPPAYRGVYGAVTAALEPANDVLESLV